MPKRRITQKFTSEHLQGENSYVVVSFMTVAEQRAAIEKRQQAKSKNVEFDAFEVGLDILKAHVLEWNWVDNDGKALPQMQDDPSVVEQLLDPEVAFLGECIQGSEEEAKN